MKKTFKSSKIPTVKFYDKVSHRTYEIPKKDFKPVEEIICVSLWDIRYPITKEWLNEIFFKRNLNILLTNDGRYYYVTHAVFDKIIDVLGHFQ